mmetsp:Transcript_5672/g.19274  ORF Transcript_5672/g.19274 Transcript_5672/m.19274 type:complete len:366 (+) Transcript_5672:5581-6678(+)
MDFLRRGEVLVEEGGEDGLKDETHALVGHVREGDEVEVTEESVGDGVPPAPWGAHGPDELDVLQRLEHARGLAVVPPLVVHPLPQNLDGGLSEVLLPLRHIHVVYADHVLLAGGRAEHTLAPLVHLRVNQVLSLVGGRPRGESDKERDELLFHVVAQLILHSQRLARARVAHAEHVATGAAKAVDQVGVADRVRGGHDDLVEGFVWVHLERGYGFHPRHPLHVSVVVAELVHGAVCRRHDLVVDKGKSRFLKGLAEVRVEARTAHHVARAAHGPSDGEDELGHEHFAKVVDLLRGKSLFVLRPLVLHQQRVHDLEEAKAEVGVDGGHGLLEPLPHEVDCLRHHGVEELAHLLGVWSYIVVQGLHP